jgi:hypothetical protein
MHSEMTTAKGKERPAKRPQGSHLGFPSRIALELAPSSLAEVRGQVDGDRDQDCAEEIGQESVKKGFAADLTVARLDLGRSVGHPDGEGEVGEVAVSIGCASCLTSNPPSG